MLEGGSSESMATPPPTIFYSCNSREVDGSAGVDSDCLWSTAAGDEEEPRDGDDVRNTPSEPGWHTVSPQGSLNPKFTSWRKIRKLGRGSFGDVYKVETDSGSFLAAKEVSLLDQGSQGKQSLSQLRHEIELYSQFEHENIVQYLGTDKDNKKLCVFLELMPKGSLTTLYAKYSLTESQVSAYTRDIKCANILVDASGSVKLADFGLAKTTEMSAAKSFTGTILWMAPEVLKNEEGRSYDSAVDIWSLGCTVLKMFTRQAPYSGDSYGQDLEKIGRGEPPLVPKFLSENTRDFIRRCLQ